ncbi:hypothetical protein BGW38_004032 [Lunasporangiospora selenospora]|uniref:Glutathione S-transferase n=1 Tax=Lunasporangiospora selenospora TaxID=979761 RepID=A0A9P6FRY4_9FUNG|nr:hypothetical protein BGW38_004032 [Lunasporangiospora selenospora]
MVHSNQVHASFDPVNAASYALGPAHKQSSFEVNYFNIHGFGQNPRTLLALAGVSFKSHTPEKWIEEEMAKTAFGVMPVLKETTVDGKVLEISESVAIEHYLGRIFGLYGDNHFEQTVIDQFYHSTSSLLDQIYSRKFGYKDHPKILEDNLKKLSETYVPTWAKYHEAHLQANGANGHYVGNKFSIADVRSANLIPVIQSITGETIVSESKTPAIWKLKTTLEANPSYAAYTETDEFKGHCKGNMEYYGF